jgi:hypothetical protein
MRSLGSVSMCRSIMLRRLSMSCLLKIIKHIPLNLAESPQSSPDLAVWSIHI